MGRGRIEGEGKGKGRRLVTSCSFIVSSFQNLSLVFTKIRRDQPSAYFSDYKRVSIFLFLYIDELPFIFLQFIVVFVFIFVLIGGSGRGEHEA